MIRIGILGGGHVGHALAALLGAQPGLSVRIWGRSLRKPAHLTLRACGPAGTIAVGAAISERSARRAVDGADIVVVTVPTHVRHAILSSVASDLGACMVLVAWEGTGRFADSLRELRIHAPAAAGLQRSPLVCRIRRRGRSVEILGVRSSVVAATVDAGDRARVQRLLSRLLPFPLAWARDYRCVSLSPGNQLIHPARLYACAGSGQRPRARTRFYADWDHAASRTLLALHHEVAALRDRLRLPRAFVRTLADRMPPLSAGDVTREIRRQRQLREILLPMRGGRLDRSHRFFLEDIGHGLAYLLERGRDAGVNMPTAEAIERWYLED